MRSYYIAYGDKVTAEITHSSSDCSKMFIAMYLYNRDDICVVLSIDVIKVEMKIKKTLKNVQKTWRK